MLAEFIFELFLFCFSTGPSTVSQSNNNNISNNNNNNNNSNTTQISQDQAERATWGSKKINII